MFSKINKKLHNMSTQDWIVMGLWVLTLVMLLAFVLVAAVVPKGIVGHKAVVAVSPVTGSYGTPSVTQVIAAPATFTNSAAETHATVLAAVGGTFVAVLFGALTTTVAFAFTKRKGGSND